MDFSASLNKWRTEEFDAALYDDFEKHAFDLPLEHACETGGWADREDAVEFTMEKVEDREQEIFVAADVSFTEVTPEDVLTCRCGRVGMVYFG